MRFQFSILRLLLAVPMVAVPFALLQPLGMVECLVALWIGAPLAGLALIAQTDQFDSMLRSVIVALAGAGCGLAFNSMVNSPTESVEHIPYVAGGATLAWIAFATGRRQSQGANPSGE